MRASSLSRPSRCRRGSPLGSPERSVRCRGGNHARWRAGASLLRRESFLSRAKRGMVGCGAGWGVRSHGSTARLTARTSPTRTTSRVRSVVPRGPGAASPWRVAGWGGAADVCGFCMLSLLGLASASVRTAGTAAPSSAGAVDIRAPRPPRLAATSGARRCVVTRAHRATTRPGRAL